MRSSGKCEAGEAMPTVGAGVSDRTVTEPSEACFRRRRSSHGSSGARCLPPEIGIDSRFAAPTTGSNLLGGAAGSTSPRSARRDNRHGAAPLSSRESSQDVVRDVYRRHAVTFFDELRAWFTMEARTLRNEAEKQLEADELRDLRQRVELLEANTLTNMPTSAGDAAAGAGASPRSISPNSRFAVEAGLDMSKMRSLCHEEARRALEELRSELLGGDLLCDELLSGGAGLRPAIERLLCESTGPRRKDRLSSEVAELRASVDGAAAAATAAATAEIGRLDGAFRSSLAAEVRDLGSLCESVRTRIEALDHSAAEHIGRLSTRLSELEVRNETSCAASRAPSVGSSSCRMEGEASYYIDACELGRSSRKADWSSGFGGLSVPALDRIGVTALHGSPSTTSMIGRQESGGSCSLPLPCGGAFIYGDGLGPTPREVHWAMPQSRLQPQDASPRNSSRSMPPAPPALGSAKIPATSVSAPSANANCMEMSGKKGDVLRSPSTPPKRHIPPGSAAATVAALRSPAADGNGAGCAARAALASDNFGKGVQKQWTPLLSPGRREVRGGC